MTVKLIVFDWDGTIVNSFRKIYLCKEFLAKKHKLPVPHEHVVRDALGMPFEKAMTTCFPFANKALLRKLMTEFHSLMQQDQYQADLYPDAYNILLELKYKGIKLAIATSKARDELDSALKYLGVEHLFDLTCCGEEYQNKPDPAMLCHILSRFDIKNSECLMVGDTTTDIDFANNASIKSIGVSFGAHSRERLNARNPLVLIDEWVQLLNIEGISCLKKVLS